MAASSFYLATSLTGQSVGYSMLSITSGAVPSVGCPILLITTGTSDCPDIPLVGQWWPR